jgi:hypothetical protein
MNKFTAYTYVAGILILVFMFGYGVSSMNLILKNNEAHATGGAGEIKGLIDPIIDRAITALQQNNTELALEEIETLKNELDDTFSTDEKEDKDDD